MRDQIGNVIKEGDLLKWELPAEIKSILVVAAQVSEGGLSKGTTNETTEPSLRVSLVIPISGVQAGREAILRDFLCVRDPRSENLLDKITGGKAS
jgi:hypothetical protein